MRKTNVILKDYVGKMPTENLKFLFERLATRCSGDLSESLDFISTNGDMDKWLKSADSSDNFYNMLDLIEEYVEREYRKRLPEIVVA